jgi:hypothetical protein
MNQPNKPKKKRAAPAPTKSRVRRTFERTKRDAYMRMHALLMDANEADRGALAEFMVDTSLTLLGKVKNMDTQSAMVVFPDDGTLHMYQAIMEHADETGIDIEEICEALISTLKRPRGVSLVN